MGRIAIYMIISLSILIAAFTYLLTRDSSDAVVNEVSLLKSDVARNIAHSAVNIVLHQFDLGSLGTSFSGNLQGGSYTVATAASGDTVHMHVQSSYVDTEYVMDVTLFRYPKPFPQPNSAVGLSCDSLGFSMSGSPSITGKDTNPDGSAGPDSTMPGVTVKTSLDSSAVSPYSSKITGSPAVAVSSTIPQPGNYMNEFFANATVVLPSSVSGNMRTAPPPSRPSRFMTAISASAARSPSTASLR